MYSSNCKPLIKEKKFRTNRPQNAPVRTIVDGRHLDILGHTETAQRLRILRPSWLAFRLLAQYSHILFGSVAPYSNILFGSGSVHTKKTKRNALPQQSRIAAAGRGRCCSCDPRDRESS
jgi:hypothetical protein